MSLISINQKLAGVALLSIGLAGCAGSKISKSDCDDANYYQMGLEDGQDGETAERLQKYREACGTNAVAEENYNYGRQVGLVDYCDAERGEDDAEDMEISSVCRQMNVPPYETAYINTLKENRDDIEEELGDVREDLNELQEKEYQLQGQLNQIDSESAPITE